MDVEAQCSRVERIVGEVDELLRSSPQSPRLKKTVGELASGLRHYYSIKHDGDYLAEVLQKHPNWHKRVAHLGSHCKTLVSDMQAIHELLRGEDEAAQQRLKIWLVRFQDYVSQENELVSKAYCLEIGTPH